MVKDIIDFNTGKRKNGANSIEKYFFKLMNNSVYGKATENLRKRINVSRLVNNVKVYKKCVSKPNFISQKTFTKNFDAIHEIKPVLTLEKPIFVGFSVLDLSKLSMYELHCKYIKTKFNANLLFTDTGSLVDEVKTDDVYKDFYGHKNLFDFSDYPQDSKFFDLINEKVTANMKDSKQKLLMNLLD